MTDERSTEERGLTRLRLGYALRVADSASGDSVLSLQDRDGRLLMRLTLTSDGPVLEIESRSLAITSHGPLRLDCERMEINAERDVTIRAQHLRQEVREDAALAAGGLITTEGLAQHHRARLGDMTLRANDDVCLDGERVRLNSPQPARPVPPEDLAVALPVLPAAKR
jgi:hypothetical protein